MPVGHGQTRPGYVVTCALGFALATASALVFSKHGPDLLWGIGGCPARRGTSRRRSRCDSYTVATIAASSIGVGTVG